MPGKICKECGFEGRNGHSLICSQRNEQKNIEFHVASQDYFGTLATVISLSRQTGQEIPESVINDLIYLQQNYKIVNKSSFQPF